MQNVGSIKGSFIIDDSDFQGASKRSIKSSKQVEKSFGGMTKSLVTAQAAYDLFRKVLTVTIQTIQKGIKSAISYQETLNKFKVIFGDGTKVINEASDALQNLTTNYGLTKKQATEMLSSTGDLLTGLGFTKKEAIGLSEQIQTLSVDLASFQNIEGGANQASEALTKALLGETESAKTLGIVIKQNTKEFRSQVQQLVETKGMTEMQAKAQLILSQAYAQSQNAVGDYARTSESLANMQKRLKAINDDSIMQMGSLFLPLVKDVTRSMLDASIATNRFLNNQKKMNSVMAGLKTFGNIIKNTVTTAFKTFVDTISPLKTIFTENADLLKGALNVGLTALSYIVAVLAGYVTILLKGWKMVITLWSDVIKAGLNVIKIFKAIAEGIASGDWNTAKKNMGAVVSSFKSMGLEIADVGKEIAQVSVDSVTNLLNKSNKGMDGLKKLYDEAYAEITETVVTETNDRTNEEIKEEEKALEKKKGILDEYREYVEKKQADELKSKMDHLRDMKDAAIKAGEDEKEVNKNVFDQMAEVATQAAFKVIEKFQFIAGKAVELYQAITEVVNSFYENDYNALVASNEAKLEELERDKEERLTGLNNEYENDLLALQAKLDNDLITREEYNTQKDILDKQRAKKEEETIAGMDKKIAAQKKKNKEKENAEKKKQFEANKTNQIAMIWIQFALGAVAAWVQSISQLGPIAGAVFAGVLTAAMLAVAIAQTVSISNQKFVPEKYLGGPVEGNQAYSVNERGQEIFTPGVNGYISPASVTDRIVANAQDKMGGKNITVNVSFNGAQITDRVSLKEVTNYVMGQMQIELEKVM
jgi:hypothetical protein